MASAPQQQQTQQQSIKDAPAAIPDGYAAVPITAEQLGAALRVCVILKRVADPVAGHLVPLRDHLDAQVYLGCVTDASNKLHQWVEVWVQNVAGVSNSLPAQRETLTNNQLDERWARHFTSYERLNARTLIRTGAERKHPRPTFLDLTAATPVHPGTWKLCEDDALLVSAGLPPYRTTLHRYLYMEEQAANSPFVPVTPNAPTTQSVKPIEELTGGRKDLVPFNPGGGLMLIRQYHHLSYEHYIDFLGGAVSQGIMHGKSSLHLQPEAPRENAQQANLGGDGWLYLGKHGRSGRLLETLHLKLRAFADAVEWVRETVRQHQRPLLNVSADSFQVKLADAGSGLPTLWTAATVLVDPGDALELPIAGSETEYFVPGRAAQASIYRPDVATTPVGGRCSLRIRQMLPDVGGATVLEGTFATQERLIPNKNDLAWLRVQLASGPVNLYARIEQQTALAAGEYRFRTIPQRFTPEVNAQLKAAAGVPIGNTTFEILAQLSTPVDLFAISVLGVRTLLVNAEAPLPVALDEALSLAQQVAVEYDQAVPLGQRIRGIFERDNRWVLSLGPQRLVHEVVTPEEAFDLVPPEVWWDALGLVIRMFPGVGPDSICADFGDAARGGLHRVFDGASADLAALLVRTRSLIVIDWRANREIHSVIRHYLTGLAEEVAGPVRAR